MGDIIDTPDIVRELTDYEVGDKCRRYIVMDDAGADIDIHAGIKDNFPNCYEPPRMIFDYDNLFDLVDNLVNNNIDAMYDNAKELFDYELEVDKEISVSDSSSRSVEQYMIQGGDVFGREVTLVNPRVRSLYAMGDGGITCSVVVVNSESDYVDKIMRATEHLDIDVEVFDSWDDFEPEDDVQYYLGANVRLKDRFQNWVGYAPNPVSIINQNFIVDRYARTESGDYYTYSDGSHKIHFCYPHGYEGFYIYPVDTIVWNYESKPFFSDGPNFYDIWSSNTIKLSSPPIRFGVVSPVGAVYSMQQVHHSKYTVGNKKKMIDRSSPLSYGVSYRRKTYIQDSDDGKVRQLSRYMRNTYTSSIIDMGSKVSFRKGGNDIIYQGQGYTEEQISIHSRADLVLRWDKAGDIDYKGVKYKRLPRFSSTNKIVDLMHSCFYDTSFYKNVYGAYVDYQVMLGASDEERPWEKVPYRLLRRWMPDKYVRELKNYVGSVIRVFTRGDEIVFNFPRKYDYMFESSPVKTYFNKRCEARFYLNS